MAGTFQHSTESRGLSPKSPLLPATPGGLRALQGPEEGAQATATGQRGLCCSQPPAWASPPPVKATARASWGARGAFCGALAHLGRHRSPRGTEAAAAGSGKRQD